MERGARVVCHHGPPFSFRRGESHDQQAAEQDRRESILTKDEERELAELEARIGDLPGGETAEDIRTMQLLRESLDMIEKAQMKAP
jgi:hypothetical protein